MKTIQSPDGVALLMENLWLRHNAGMKQRPCNVFMVELQPPTDEELADVRQKNTGPITTDVGTGKSFVNVKKNTMCITK